MVLPRATVAGFRWDDLVALPDDGNRYELLDGVLSVVPPPSSEHQSCVFLLARLLHDARPPDLVSTRRHDRGDKLLAYQEYGVPYYWLMDPAGPTLTALHLRDGRYVEHAGVTGDDPYDATEPFPVTVVPARLLDE